MYSKKIKILFVVFLATALLAVFSLWKDSVAVGKNQVVKFGIDTSDISSVKLLYNGVSTDLRRTNNVWYVNQKYKAREQSVALMKVAFAKAESKRPVSPEHKQKILDTLLKKGVRVEVTTSEGIKKFFIYTNPNDINSAYYAEDASKEPYIMHVPGYSNSMANLFMMDESGWRSRELFRSSPRTLKRLQIHYPQSPENNFEIVYQSMNRFTVVGLTQIDSARLYDYLYEYEYMNCDGYVYKDRDNILRKLSKVTPHAIIRVEDADSVKNKTLKIYMGVSGIQGIAGVVEPGNELLQFRKETLFRILVKKKYFEKNKSPLRR
ncbi:MAG: DUF4340 domain-containing protein [Cytophagaceae bacterium]|nr:DUF4340 domain-containing protein [Cytophagaceae bacterium]MDW8457221.1 DUF4340 domain-containing protein [Cytophagaceae bacterium]